MTEETTLQNYQALAIRTDCLYGEDIAARAANPSFTRLLHAGMGLSTESGELVDNLKRHLFYGKPIDVPNLLEEAGDLCWYLALLLDELGSDFETIMKMNIDKLRARYPQKFTEHHALNRDLEKEREILEAATVGGE